MHACLWKMNIKYAPDDVYIWNYLSRSELYLLKLNLPHGDAKVL